MAYVTQVKFVFDPLKRRYEHANLEAGIFDRKESSTADDRQLDDRNSLLTAITPPHTPKDTHLNDNKHTLYEVTIPNYYDDYDASFYQYNDQYYSDNKDSTILAAGKSEEKKQNSYEHEVNSNDLKKHGSTEKFRYHKSDGMKSGEKDSYYVDSFEYEYQYDYPKNRNAEFAKRKRRSDSKFTNMTIAGDSDEHRKMLRCSKKKNCHKKKRFQNMINSSNHNSKNMHIHKDRKIAHTAKFSKPNDDEVSLPNGIDSISKERSHYKIRNPRQTSGNDPLPYRSLEGVIRVAFTGLEMSSNYLIRGSAGDVFNFREKGIFNISSPAVYLVSRIRLLLPVAHGRHPKRNRFVIFIHILLKIDIFSEKNSAVFVYKFELISNYCSLIIKL